MEKIRVAIVDDDPTYGRAVARLLRASRLEAVTFRSAEEYLASGRAEGADCLLVDVDLGGMSGFALRERLRSAGSRLPVVFISGHTEASIPLQAAEAGCAFVSKGEPGAVILEAIRHAVAG